MRGEPTHSVEADQHFEIVKRLIGSSTPMGIHMMDSRPCAVLSQQWPGEDAMRAASQDDDAEHAYAFLQVLQRMRVENFLSFGVGRAVQ